MSLPSNPSGPSSGPAVPPSLDHLSSSPENVPAIPLPSHENFQSSSDAAASPISETGNLGQPAGDGDGPQTPPSFERSKASLSVDQVIRKTLGTVWVFLGSQVGLSLILGLGLGFLLGALSIVDTGPLAGFIWWFQRNVTVLVTILAVTGSGLLTAFFGSSQLKIRLFQELTNTKFDKKWLFQGTAMLYTASFTLGLLITLINALTSRFGLGIEENVLPDAYGFLANLLFFVCVAVVGPVLEECIFRGVICSSLARFNKGFAVIFSALLFGLVHMNLYQAIPAFGMGIVLGFVYLRSGSLLPAIFMHIFNNTLSMLVSYLPDTGFLPILASLLVIGLAVGGLVLMIQQKKEIGMMVAQCRQAAAEWKVTLHSFSFWMIPVCFIGLQLISALAAYIMSFLLYYMFF